MNASQLFSGRVFVCRERRYKIQNYKYKTLIERILADACIDSLTQFVIEEDGDENFDCLILEQGEMSMRPQSGVEYSSGNGPKKSTKYVEPKKNKLNGECFKLKFSFGDSHESLDREIEFLKSNDSIFTDKYIADGKVKFGDRATYLLTSVEKADSMCSLGRYALIDNVPSFIFSSLAFAKTKCDRSFKGYIDDFFKERDTSDLPEAFVDSLELDYDIKDVKAVFNYFRSEVNNAYDESIMEAESVCHGNLNIDNVLFREGRFKFINCNDSFNGNKLLDLSFFAISCGLTKDQMDMLVDNYIRSLNLDADETRKQFQACLKVSVLIYCSRLIYSYIIENLVFLGKNKSKTLSLIDQFSRSFHFLDEFGVMPEHLSSVRNMFIDPILRSQADVELVPSSVAQKDRIIDKKRIKTPEVKVSLLNDDDGNPFLNIKWKTVNDFSDYFCYVIKPNGKVQEYKDLSCTEIIYDKVDVLGDYGVGVKSIGDENNEDSDFNITKVSILNI